MPTILQMNFEFRNTPDEEKQQGPAFAKTIAQVPGLLWKIWLMDEATHQAGGIYLFESQAAAQTYLNGPITQAIRHNPTYVNWQVRLTPIWVAPTAITANSTISTLVDG